MNSYDIVECFKSMYKNGNFVTDKTGCKMIEVIGVSYSIDSDVLFGTLNEEYAKKEVEWYMTQSLNVYDMKDPPTIWKQVADKDGFINSNYGWCIFSKENGEQYKNCIEELKKNKDSRRAVMIYTRPSMWKDYNKNGMSDFICTNNVQLFIRNNNLIYVINQRSCDAVYGYKNDIYWHRTVFNKALNELKEFYPELKKGDFIHQVGSLHLYERHFKFL